MKNFKLIRLDNLCHLKTVENPYFQEFNIASSIIPPCERVQNKNIKTSIVTIDLISVKCVTTVEGTSLEGQHLTGKKINIIGTARLEIIYNCMYDCKKFCHTEDNINFNTFIVMPNDVCEEGPFHIEYYIEDVEIVVIAPGKLFANIAVYMAYKDQY